MSEKYKFYDDYGIYFTTSTIINWISIFNSKEYCDIIIDSLKFCQEKKGLLIHAWCLMPNHLHLIISISEIKNNQLLSDIIRDFKRFTSTQIIEQLKLSNVDNKDKLLFSFYNAGKNLKHIKNYKLWKDGNHPIELNNNFIIDQKLQYIHHNPIKANIVNVAEDYPYSSAIDYAGGSGLINIAFIDR